MPKPTAGAHRHTNTTSTARFLPPSDNRFPSGTVSLFRTFGANTTFRKYPAVNPSNYRRLRSDYVNRRVLQCETMASGTVESTDPGGVRVLHKTLDILEAVKSRESGYRLAELARAVEMPKATVYRILTT